MSNFNPQAIALPLLFWLCSLCTATAQSSSSKAVLNLRDGTTISGYIQTPKHKLTRKKIQFSKSIGGEIELYSATDISSFMYQGIQYIGHTMPIDMSTIALNQVELGDAVIIREDTFFMEEIARGSISLYEYVDANLKHHYIIKDKNGKISELPFSRTVKHDKKTLKISILEKRGYRNVLGLLMEDCATLQKKISKVQYKRESLTKLFQEYYICKAEIEPNIVERPGGGIKLDVFGGLLNVNADRRIGANLETFKYRNAPILGGGIEIGFRGRFRHLSAFYDVSYLLLQQENNYTYNFMSTTIEYLYGMNMGLIKNTFGGRIYTPKRTFRPFGEFGVGFGLHTKFQVQETNLTSNRVDLDYSSPEKTSYGYFSLGAGVLAWNKVSILLGAEFAKASLPLVSTSVKMQGAYILARYRLLDTEKE